MLRGRIKRIRKRSGQIVLFDENKLVYAIFRAARSVGGTNIARSREVAKLVIKKLEEQYKGKNIPTVEDVQDLIEKTLIEEGHAKTSKAFILYRQQKNQERAAKTAIVGKVTETKLSLNALKILKERYLLKNDDGKVIETPSDMFFRVAKAIAKAEAKWGLDVEGRKELTKSYYDMMANLDFLPSSSILINAGTKDQYLYSSCAIPLEDTISDILTSLKDASICQQSGGGTGFNFSKLRSKFSAVKGSDAVAAGPGAFLELFSKAMSVIKQSGKREGANMAILSAHHPDVLSFSSIKNTNKSLYNFNISIMLDESFIKAAVLDKEYDLINPHTGVVNDRVNARQVFDYLVANAHHVADPGILFYDKINEDNPTPHLGSIEHTSPCAEFMLLEYECGFIGSVNLATMVVNKQINYDKLKTVVHQSIRFLDDALEVSKFALSQSKDITLMNRKLGLGVMGFSHMLCQLGIAYDSEEGLHTAETVMQFMRQEADNASVELAKKRGVFDSWSKSVYCNKSKHFKGQHMRLRNATRLAISPTGTISMLADVSSSIEPLFALSYTKRIMDGRELFYIDKFLKRALIAENIYSEELEETIANTGSIKSIGAIPEHIKKAFVTTHDITPTYHLKMQAAFQKYVDNAVSKTVNFPNHANFVDIENAFLLAYMLGCKGITVYRDGSFDNQVINFMQALKKEGGESKKSVRLELKNLFENQKLTKW